MLARNKKLTVEIKAEPRYANYLFKHLKKEHPGVIGKIHLKGKN